MSLSNISLSQIVLKQTKWKFLTYSQALLALVFIQVVFSLLLSNGSGMSWGGANQISVETRFYNLDGVVMVGGMWAFITGILFQTKGYRYDDYSVITNRVTASIANTLVLVMYSFIGTLISVMTLYLLAGAVRLFSSNEFVSSSLMISPLQFAVSVVILLLAASIGYFLSTLFQLSKWVSLLTIGLFGLSLFVIFLFGLVVRPLDEYILSIILFFVGDGYPLFIVKGSIVSILLFAISIVLLSRKEVER